MRFVHTADWQLGMTRYFLNGEAQPRYSAARREAVVTLGGIAAEAGAEFVVVAGDVFEHNQLAPREVSLSLEAMRAAGVPIYLLPGNHDPLDASSVYRSALFTSECPANVTVLDRAGVYEVRPGLELVAAPWTSKHPTSDPVAGVLADLPADGTTRIVVGHGGVDIFVPDPERPSLIRLAALEDAVERGAVHYVALGDKHSRMQVGSTGRIWYSGSPEVTNYDDIETDPGHVLVVDVDEADPAHPVRVEARKVGRWRFVTLERAVDNSRDITDLDINLDQFPDKERTVVRLVLTGSLTVTDQAALDECVAKYDRRFAALRIDEKLSEIAVLPADGEFDDLGIGGFAAAAVDELVATARSDGEDADDARAALALLLRLADRGVA
ncbi:DNA repair exonuclease [Mycolicibacterium phlei]|uniref:Nuclease SbcCD subunit D n=1 Tax=Mycolicibacterium phlei DSM 43239 = CCUG 21000 TaxID=1226750 RepID=A0A5N5V1Y8_MYCPH|nr:exonuclease SbcCD subunit D [Mycolicibacterium phlei]VEG10866.1 DNA repair exonuclease [Mycobacteroides chelonae]AMO62765.1 exonuclease subunit SbcD [Mycolicibacterium phlei]KAB7755911.1 DNA repair exonuclease SbcD [Mycolicibacterium phlei DSM 43239 = CCUG 21000]KXW65867.1 DNA repair exonuclease SbcD [Mycolicibacterium phlei DSM 43239 = CCUG 21000]KXW68181.1 DNA repair exonuclease SbcD [Mycolicibacterium phlei DSM 43072]